MAEPDRNLLLNSILRWLHSQKRKRASLALLVAIAQSRGWEAITSDELKTELEALADRQLVEKLDELSAEASIWRLTATGINYVIERGLQE